MLVKPEKTVAEKAEGGFRLPFFEFVSLIALLMALTALSIDVMLPALPQMVSSLGAASRNEQQLVIVIYLGGFALGQLLFGPISDRFGRKIPLLVGLAIYCPATVLALTSPHFFALLLARALQGFGAASPRVIALAIVRDRFQGREMARVMSLVMMVFIVVPVLAPSLGEGILQFAGWRGIFIFLLVAAIAAGLWAGLRLPETRLPEDRLPLTAHGIFGALRLVISSRQAAGYIVCLGFIFGILMSYIVSAQQIFVDVYRLGANFPLVFGAIAIFMIASSIVNASVVRRFGMRAVSQSALLCALVLCGIVALAGYPAKPPLVLFGVFMAAIFFLFGLITPNLNALAMEPVGHVAGTASSLSGFYTTAAGAALGALVGQQFNGSVRPVFIGISAFVVLTFLAVLFIERFRLFRTGSGVRS